MFAALDSQPAAPCQPSPDLARWLEEIYRVYHRPEFRGSDPIDALAPYRDAGDREIVGFVAAMLAYGNVKAILGGIRDVLERICGKGGPRDYLIQSSASQIRRDLRGFRYRVTSGGQMASLLMGLSRLVREHGSLNAAFVRHLDGRAADIVPALGRFVTELVEAAESDLYHLAPHPERGSACKRLMLYLRWMVRSDAIDPGGWTGLRPAQLVIPLDRHMHRMALGLGLTRRKQPNLATALEITGVFRRLVADDPLRYDFALTRPGILRIVQSLPAEGILSSRQSRGVGGAVAGVAGWCCLTTPPPRLDLPDRLVLSEIGRRVRQGEPDASWDRHRVGEKQGRA